MTVRAWTVVLTMTTVDPQATDRDAWEIAVDLDPLVPGWVVELESVERVEQ